MALEACKSGSPRRVAAGQFATRSGGGGGRRKGQAGHGDNSGGLVHSVV